MIDHPENTVENFVMAGASRLVLHLESKGDLPGTIAKLTGKVDIGLALNIATPLEAVKPFIDSIQYIQLMGINRVGYQGQEFEPKVVARIRECQKLYPNLPVSVDGAVSLETAPELISAGATRLVVGSGIFNSENIIETITRFKRL